MEKHIFPYKWNLKDGYPAKGIHSHKLKVFSCFACGGGSTMGYKLAGYDVLGCNEIDPKMMEAYKVNHNPKYAFLEPIQTFKLRKDLPKELYNLDILDGSPPCSNFSMAGNREKDWGKEKKFREGQVKQVLDTLFFDFIDLAKELQPKVVVAENVKGILMGQAMSYKTNYVGKIHKEFEKAGYYSQHFLLDASKMGVPQKRERVFFIAFRKDLGKQFLSKKLIFDNVPELKLKFNEKGITFREIEYTEKEIKKLTLDSLYWWNLCPKGYSFSKIHPKGHWFNSYKVDYNEICPTIAAATGASATYHPEIPRTMNKIELILAGSFPKDFNFINNKPKYLIGMSVPPIMIAQIANQIYIQWLSKLKK